MANTKLAITKIKVTDIASSTLLDNTVVLRSIFLAFIRDVLCLRTPSKQRVHP